MTRGMSLLILPAKSCGNLAKLDNVILVGDLCLSRSGLRRIFDESGNHLHAFESRDLFFSSVELTLAWRGNADELIRFHKVQRKIATAYIAIGANQFHLQKISLGNPPFGAVIAEPFSDLSTGPAIRVLRRRLRDAAIHFSKKHVLSNRPVNYNLKRCELGAVGAVRLHLGGRWLLIRNGLLVLRCDPSVLGHDLTPDVEKAGRALDVGLEAHLFQLKARSHEPELG
jgi:hypothetical protein